MTRDRMSFHFLKERNASLSAVRGKNGLNWGGLWSCVWQPGLCVNKPLVKGRESQAFSGLHCAQLHEFTLGVRWWLSERYIHVFISKTNRCHCYGLALKRPKNSHAWRWLNHGEWTHPLMSSKVKCIARRWGLVRGGSLRAQPGRIYSLPSLSLLPLSLAAMIEQLFLPHAPLPCCFWLAASWQGTKTLSQKKSGSLLP